MNLTKTANAQRRGNEVWESVEMGSCAARFRATTGPPCAGYLTAVNVCMDRLTLASVVSSTRPPVAGLIA